MKKTLINALIALTITSSLSSCATVFGGKVNQAQRTKPLPGEPSRPIRPVALIADILLFWPGAIVDFATGAIYKPGGNGVSKPATTTETPKAANQG
ncbi:hypothetical protein [Pedobacter sp. BMA]|uniref:hypothetical protein n=1 Tax=Pedobacter sp. BMA TaxID=1663685 RepID=UPI00064ABABB|nr:hypothetical protein [Pedobacter sp. BMA]KLT65201.1 hypothetical protein AB669_16110 [Pedobacter sp. BMA]